MYLVDLESFVIPGMRKGNSDVTRMERMPTKDGDIEASAANSTLASIGPMSS